MPIVYEFLCIFANVNEKMTAKMATDKTAYWLDIADYDLDTAEAMHQTGRWLYVAFMCHQVIKKTLTCSPHRPADRLSTKQNNCSNG